MNEEENPKPSFGKVAGAMARAAATALRPKYGTITPADLDARIRSGEALTIIDVRTSDVFEERHIEGAVNLPFPDFDDHRSEVPVGRPVVAVCYRGLISRTAAQHLADDGHATVVNLEGGMSGWQEHLRSAGAAVGDSAFDDDGAGS